MEEEGVVQRRKVEKKRGAGGEIRLDKAGMGMLVP